MIVTCENLVDPEELRDDPHHNQIPFIHVDAVVHVPGGAYPRPVTTTYDYDPVYLKAYSKEAKDDTRFNAFMDRHVYGHADHRALLDFVGTERLNTIKATPPMGYAANLVRG